MQKMHWTKSNTLHKTLKKLGTEWKFLNLIKGICETLTANIISNQERLKTSSPNQEYDKVSTLTTSIQYCTRDFSQDN
jgi:hypothetical protein